MKNENKLSNTEIRKMLVEHKTRYGTSYKHIAKQTGISRTSISTFANNDDKILVDATLQKIKDYLEFADVSINKEGE